VRIIRDLIHDCKRFLMYARSGMEQAPLQTYVSAALFAPSESVVRKLAAKTTLFGCVKRSPRTLEHWSALLLTLEGHLDCVNDVQFSQDGNKLASASYDKKVIVWDASTGARLHTPEGHSVWVNAVQFSPDGNKLASASYDEKVIVWDASIGARLHTLKGHSGAVNAVQFSPDGNKLASASRDKKVIVWDLKNTSLIETISVGGFVSKLSFSADGRYLKTNIGSFELKSRVAVSFSDATYPHHLQVHGEWILRHGHKMIWVPPELRPLPHATAIHGANVVFGLSSGAVSFWEICA
jgi:WD40 repeat protein